jgi:hypothetical protein
MLGCVFAVLLPYIGDHSTNILASYTVLNPNNTPVNRNTHGGLHQRLGCGVIPRLVILRHGACDKKRISRGVHTTQRAVRERDASYRRQASKVCATFK